MLALRTMRKAPSTAATHKNCACSVLSVYFFSALQISSDGVLLYLFILGAGAGLALAHRETQLAETAALQVESTEPDPTPEHLDLILVSALWFVVGCIGFIKFT